MNVGISELDIIILQNLTEPELYHVCTTNKYFLNLCRNNKDLADKFNNYRHCLEHHQNYLNVLDAINPETGRRIVKGGIVYRGLLDKYKCKCYNK